MINSVLRTKPVKMLPRQIIYSPQGSNIYHMISNGEYAGYMVGAPTINQFFYIYNLLIFNQKRQGLGTKFLDYAQKLSRDFGCEGRIELTASTLSADPQTPPHQFYRKYGFSAYDKKTLKKIDKSIRVGKKLNWWEVGDTDMYYPSNDKIPKPGLIFKLKNLFRK